VYGLPPTGIPYVLVGSTNVVDDSKALEDVYPGQEICYPVTSESKFTPLDNEGAWVETTKYLHLKATTIPLPLDRDPSYRETVKYPGTFWGSVRLHPALRSSSRRIRRSVFASTAADLLLIDCLRASLIIVW